MSINPATQTNLIIMVCVVAVLYWTQNPLAIMALLLMHQWQGGDQQQLADAEGEPEPLYQEHEMGFNAKL